jgi:hypothetical protein
MQVIGLKFLQQNRPKIIFLELTAFGLKYLQHFKIKKKYKKLRTKDISHINLIEMHLFTLM